ncbi:MAG: ribose 5-phosphate isomerase A [Zestosphaera sp.]
MEEIRARLAAVAEAIKFLQGRKLIGLGTGSTTELFIKKAHERGLLKGKSLVATSAKTAMFLAELGYRDINPLAVEELDLYVDSADEVDLEGRMLKGGGAALTMEKLLAKHSELRVFIVDEFKVVEKLGSRHPIPVEVLPNALRMILRDLRKLGAQASPRECNGKKGPIASDVGGIIIDVIPPANIELEEFAKTLKSLTGVIETGFFLNEADIIIVGFRDGNIKYLRRT